MAAPPLPARAAGLSPRDDSSAPSPNHAAGWAIAIVLIVCGAVVYFLIWLYCVGYRRGGYTPLRPELEHCWARLGAGHVLHYNWRGRLDGWRGPYDGNPASVPPGWEVGNQFASERKMRPLFDRYGPRRNHNTGGDGGNSGGGDAGGGSGGDAGGGGGGSGGDGGGGSGGDGGG